MSLKTNVAANYASQLYVTIVGIAFIPLYIRALGAEAYGLIGFFATLQAWFTVLDLGLTPTIARETARFFGGVLTSTEYRAVFRSLSIGFAVVAIVGSCALLMLASTVSSRWLHLRTLAQTDVVTVVQIMSVSVAMRWMCGLYRGVVTGAERLVWLSGFNSLIATLRFAAVFVSMAIWGSTLTVFFWHQLVVAAIELAILVGVTARLVPRRSRAEYSARLGVSPALRPLLRFSLTIAFTSSAWVFVTQTDKLVLSGVLPLAEYGYFMLAVLVAGGITVATGPITTALLPRLARLHAEGNHGEILRLYNQFAQLVAVVAIALMVTLAGCAESLLYAWTGSRQVTEVAAPIVRLYALGNGFLALSAFPFYLQYARGNLRYHLIGNAVLAVLIIPATILSAMRAGGVGAGWAWLAVNALYLFGWVAYVHGRLEPGLHVEWILRNVLAILLPTATTGAVLVVLLPTELGNRGRAFAQVVLFASCCACAAVLSSSQLRRWLMRSVARQWS